MYIIVYCIIMSYTMSSSVVTPLKASVTGVVFTSKLSEFNVVIKNPRLTVTERGLIIRPHRVKKGALKEFRDTIPDTVPTLKNPTHEDIERLIDERNTDIFDNA